jgi:lysozyme family protein
MADIKLYEPKLIRFEGGYVNNAADKGGATKYGVTLATWQHLGHPSATADDIKNLTEDDFLIVLRTYWNQWQADLINNQSIAELLVDWVYNSGVYGIKTPQTILGVVADGQVGQKTINAINTANQAELFAKLKQARIDFFKAIVAHNPSQHIFLQGWLNRVNSFNFSENSATA